MKTIKLDCKKMIDKNTTHKYFKNKFELPAYYGNNLDSLFDCLSEKNDEIYILLENYEFLIESLGEYGYSIIELFEDLQTEYENYNFKKIKG